MQAVGAICRMALTCVKMTALLLLLVPVLVVMVTRMLIQGRRVRRLAKTFRCPGCGKLLGIASVERALEVKNEFFRDLGPAQSGLNLYVHWPLDAICVHCQETYRFDRESSTFEQTPLFDILFNQSGPKPKRKWKWRTPTQ